MLCVSASLFGSAHKHLARITHEQRVTVTATAIPTLHGSVTDLYNIGNRSTVQESVCMSSYFSETVSWLNVCLSLTT
jgi:hypothetical protein